MRHAAHAPQALTFISQMSITSLLKAMRDASALATAASASNAAGKPPPKDKPSKKKPRRRLAAEEEGERGQEQDVEEEEEEGGDGVEGTVGVRGQQATAGPALCLEVLRNLAAALRELPLASSGSGALGRGMIETVTGLLPALGAQGTCGGGVPRQGMRDV